MKIILLIALGLAAAGCARPTEAASEDAPMTSPLMPEAADLLGGWRLSGAAGPCEVELGSADAPLEVGSLAAPMRALAFARPCPGLASARGWRPTPLGLELTDARGGAVAVFERVGPGRYRSIDGAWTLDRD